ncbi:hypothetical protein [Ferrimonas balearica]|uniref:hypothetical protein n=1 Tax=Ferrimonas balearica TaxID=44012 RepID=UPI001C99AAEA|nr:hypothetical protein [Ferrimonas balearica]MBY5920314.1 hypothetical protein [Ferrimonas balearica]MBY5997001.1 hypothetical protein [Ferrimonas balearica]
MKTLTRSLSLSLFSAGFLLLSVSPSVHATPNSCWGEATQAFAQLGAMGEHASQQSNPRLGLANTARALYDIGLLSAPTMGALADYLMAELGLSLERCLNNPKAVAEAESMAAGNAACWGQASAVFAQMGMMGEHSSSFDSPRLGLRNLARALADVGVIPDDSMASLGGFVAAELGLEIEACM